MWINHHLEVRNLKVGYHIGVFGKIPLTDYLALQPGVRPTDTGAKVIQGGSGLASMSGIEEAEVLLNSVIQSNIFQTGRGRSFLALHHAERAVGFQHYGYNPVQSGYPFERMAARTSDSVTRSCRMD